MHFFTTCHFSWFNSSVLQYSWVYIWCCGRRQTRLCQFCRRGSLNVRPIIISHLRFDAINAQLLAEQSTSKTSSLITCPANVNLPRTHLARYSCQCTSRTEGLIKHTRNLVKLEQTIPPYHIQRRRETGEEMDTTGPCSAQSPHHPSCYFVLLKPYLLKSSLRHLIAMMGSSESWFVQRVLFYPY